MDPTLIISILSSTVIAGLVSAGAALYSGHKKNLIENITNDRKAWRGEIREIAVEIEAANTKQQLRKPLAELKVRINAFGIQDEDVLHDSAIWKILRQFKNANDAEIPELKEMLLRLLSCLLKYDWDRSKTEIRGNVLVIWAVLMQVVAVGIAVAAYLLTPGNFEQEVLTKMQGVELFAMPALLIVIVYFYLYGYIYGRTSPLHKKTRSKFSIGIQCCIMVLGLITVLGCTIAAFQISKLNLPGLLALTSIVLMLIHLGNDSDTRKQYEQTVKKIMEQPQQPQNTCRCRCCGRCADDDLIIEKNSSEKIKYECGY